MEVTVNRRNKRKIDGEKIFSIVASLAIIAALVVGVVSIVKSTTASKKQNYIDLNVADGGTETNAPTTIDREAQRETEKPTRKQEKQTERQTKPTKEQETEPVKEQKTEPGAETAAENVPAAAGQEQTAAEVNAPVLSFGENSSLLWPVEGNIVIGYNMDNTIYFPTLDLYKCSPSIVISAEVGTPVLSAAPGVVEDIYVDPVTGTTMVVSLGNGYKVAYGQLGNLAVGISDSVEAGTELGRIAEPTKYFSVEGSNLYFELSRDGSPVDPMLYLIERE